MKVVHEYYVCNYCGATSETPSFKYYDGEVGSTDICGDECMKKHLTMLKRMYGNDPKFSIARHLDGVWIDGKSRFCKSDKAEDLFRRSVPALCRVYHQLKLE